MLRLASSQSIINLVKTSIIGLILVLFVSILAPVIPTSAATTITNTVSTNATLNIKSAVAVSLTTDLHLEVVPESGGSFTLATADLTVATNNVTGYSVYLSAGNGSKLVASDKTNTTTIDPVDGMMNQSNYKEHLGTWGYADITGMADHGASSNYKAVPSTNEDALFSSTSEASEDSYSLGFATSIGLDQPAGLYSGSILVSVVANPKEVTNLSELTYMQDMTTSICSNTMDYVDKDNYITKQLVDIRDGQSYWVAKLADGNCWMVQNLGLTSQGMIATKGNAILTPDDSDVLSNWTLLTT